jgi:hypothetical protein
VPFRHRGGVTESKPAASPDLGVVDPMRIPGGAAARRAWDGLPILARVFIVLAAVDVVVRALGLLDTNLGLLLGVPLTWFTAFFPHDALILLPALVVIRRPDALDATPMVVRGAVLVALVEVLNAPLRGLFSGGRLDPVLLPSVVSILGILLTAGGWWWMAQGLRWMNPVRPLETYAGLANLVGGGIAFAALANLALVLFRPAADVGNATWTSLLQLDSALFAVPSLALAYLARVVVLGTGDPNRPIAATYLATASLTLYAIGSVLLLAVGEGAIWIVIGFVTGPVAMTGFVVAFGLGLADPSGTIEA